MNFLEELTAEWYEYTGHFVRRNIRFGKRDRGGYQGEIDIIAYNPRQDFIHIETSTDAYSWEKRRVRFQRKFQDAEKFYDKLFPFEKGRIMQLVIVGFTKPTIKYDWGSIRILFIPEFIKIISEELKSKDPTKEAVPESFPLLRAIQYSLFYG